MGYICSEPNSKNSMKDLCDYLLKKGYIKSYIVYNSMIQVDRIDFCPYFPYKNRPQPINYNATISAPSIHAYCLDLMKDHLKEGNKVLDIGFGSGYLTVAMSKMMNDKGIVVGIEHIKYLYNFALENICKNHKNLLDSHKIILIESDGRLGYESMGPYNCIHVGAAVKKVPSLLIEQLDKGGRMVIPIGNQGEEQFITIIDKDLNGKISFEKKLGVNFVPLTSVEEQLDK